MRQPFYKVRLQGFITAVKVWELYEIEGRGIMEIERKWIVEKLPDNLNSYPSSLVYQGYISKDPVIRIRKRDNDFYLTVKGKGHLCREEFELCIEEKSFEELLNKCEGIVLKKNRYVIPIDLSGNILKPGMNGKYSIELDVFQDDYEGLVYAEIEFDTEDEAIQFIPPEWFGEDVTLLKGYSNAELSEGNETLMNKFSLGI